MIDVTLPEGALSEEQRNALGERLTNTILKWEGAAEVPFSRQITVVFFDERPAGSIYVAGEPETQPRYRVLITIPEGSITDDERKAGLVEEVTRDILEVDGTEQQRPASPSRSASGLEDETASLRVWVFIHEVPDGHWGGAGRIFRLRDIVKLARSGGEVVPA